jgi:hypothetical protein
VLAASIIRGMMMEAALMMKVTSISETSVKFYQGAASQKTFVFYVFVE